MAPSGYRLRHVRPHQNRCLHTARQNDRTANPKVHRVPAISLIWTTLVSLLLQTHRFTIQLSGAITTLPCCTSGL